MKASHIPLHKWLLRFCLMTSSMKGVSSHQLHRSLGISYKSAWLTSHRIREAMRAGGRAAPMGGVVEADETYFGEVEEARVSPQRKGSTFVKRGRNGPANNRAIVALVERGGSVRSFHVAVADKENVARIVGENVAREATCTPARAGFNQGRGRVRGAPDGRALGRRVRRPRRGPHRHRRGRVLDLRARDEGRLPALLGEAPAPLTRGVRLPLQPPRPRGLQRRGPRRRGHRGGRGQAADLPTTLRSRRNGSGLSGRAGARGGPPGGRLDGPFRPSLGRGRPGRPFGGGLSHAARPAYGRRLEASTGLFLAVGALVPAFAGGRGGVRFGG
jgi:hypothetical protein